MRSHSLALITMLYLGVMDASEPAMARTCSADAALTAELESRHSADQERLIAWRIAKEFGQESEKAKALWKRQTRIDAGNLAWLVSLVTRDRWPAQCAVGKEGSKTAFLIAQHGDLATRKFLHAALSAAVRRGDAEGAHLAYLEDRNLVEEGMPQIYGTQWTAKGELYPVTDPRNLETRRKQVGLGPVEDYKPR